MRKPTINFDKYPDIMLYCKAKIRTLYISYLEQRNKEAFIEFVSKVIFYLEIITDIEVTISYHPALAPTSEAAIISFLTPVDYPDGVHFLHRILPSNILMARHPPLRHTVKICPLRDHLNFGLCIRKTLKGG